VLAPFKELIICIHLILHVTGRSNSLSKADLREIIAHLDSSLDILNRRSGQLSAAELSLKSMLATLKRDLEGQLKSRDHLEE
jgi:hypothetical protein